MTPHFHVSDASYHTTAEDTTLPSKGEKIEQNKNLSKKSPIVDGEKAVSPHSVLCDNF
jgi:hypothetical protein